MPKTQTIRKDERWEEDVLWCEAFKNWLADYYGMRHGSIKKFADEAHLKVTKAYRQLNGTDSLTEELRDIGDKCMKEGKVEP
jgi:hypothetical protein